MSSCACGEDWRIISCDLSTGTERTILHPLALDFEDSLDELATTGSMTLATKDIRARNIWPHLTMIVMARIGGPGASPESPKAEWIGMVEKFSAADNGATQVGLVHLGEYLNHRMMTQTVTFKQVSQTQIAAQITALAAPQGVPIIPIAAPSTWLRDRTYNSWERKFIGEALEDLSSIIEGIDWRYEYQRSSAGKWSMQIIFQDEVGEETNLVARSDYENFEYNLDVDAKDQATYVDQLGQGEEEGIPIAHAEDTSNFYPRFDAAPSTDAVEMPTLEEYAGGYLEDHQEPTTLPSLVLKGWDVDPALVRIGNTINVQSNFGAVTYKGDARIVGVSWALDVDSPVTRTVTLQPLTRASESVLFQEPTENCEEC